MTAIDGGGDGRDSSPDPRRRSRRRRRPGTTATALLLLAVAAASSPSAADAARSFAPRSLQSPWATEATFVPCSERTNQGQCKKDLACLWVATAGRCIELPVPQPPPATPTYEPTPGDGLDTPAPVSPAPVEPPTPPPVESTTPPPSPPPTDPPVDSPRPTPLPTPAATPTPTPLPTNRPTDPPTNVPTARPTARPTEGPTRSPTPYPTASPSSRPTRAPSSSPTEPPSAGPTAAPSRAPSRSPSASPTRRPTESPTLSPTSSNRPSPLIWPSASPSASTFPTSDPTAFPSEGPSESPTDPPTTSPTDRPTASPTPRPTSKPTPRPSAEEGGTPRPTIATRPPTARPTVPERRYRVFSSMALQGLDAQMDRDAVEVWIGVTEARIERHAVEIVGDGGTDVATTVWLDKQSVLGEGRRRRGQLRNGGFPRRLEATSLRITFTVTIKFDSETSAWDANEMVAAGFRSLEDQREYVLNLQEEDYEAFGAVEGMAMTVDGTVITETEENESKPADPPKQNLTVYYIVGGALGGSLLLLIAVVIWACRRKREDGKGHDALRSKASSPMSAKSAASPDPTAKVGGGAPAPPEEAFPTQQPRIPQSPPKPRPSPPQTYFGTIESREGGEDDVSTLGDPYFGDGVQAAEPRADETVAESMISSEQELYVYGVGRPRLMTGGSGTKAGEQSTVGGDGTKSGQMFGDDTALEDAYRSPETSLGGGVSASSPRGAQRVVVEAPPGKLGIVVDNPAGDLPVVHAIKETSVLNGRAGVGDRLLKVDEVDCRGMTAVQVSRLISSRSRNPTRTLVLLRGGGGPGEG
ncbi:hypothetical protein ACHAWF_014568 [Thalassiosira exigua]